MKVTPHDLPLPLLLLLGAHMLSHTEWVSDCVCEWEFVSCCPTLRMSASWSPHGHKLPKYKLSRLYYGSHGVGACFWGTKGQVEGGGPCESRVLVKRWVTLSIWICSMKNWTFIKFVCSCWGMRCLMTVISWSLPRPPALFPWHSCAFLIPCGWGRGGGGGGRGSCSSQRCLG